MGDRVNGPTCTVKLSCLDCKHEESVSYAVQSDTGFHVYCQHPTVGKRRIGFSWDTPAWCPFLNTEKSDGR